MSRDQTVSEITYLINYGIIKQKKRGVIEHTMKTNVVHWDIFFKIAIVLNAIVFYYTIILYKKRWLPNCI